MAVFRALLHQLEEASASLLLETETKGFSVEPRLNMQTHEPLLVELILPVAEAAANSTRASLQPVSSSAGRTAKGMCLMARMVLPLCVLY